MIQNLNQFKKWLEVGKEIKFIKNVILPEKAGMTRRITKVQTNGLYTEIEGKNSWLEIPKAKDVIVEDGKINILADFLSKYDMDYLNKLKNIPNMQNRYEEQLQTIQKRKQELLDNGAEFINDNQYIWLSIEPVM